MCKNINSTHLRSTNMNYSEQSYNNSGALEWKARLDIQRQCSGGAAGLRSGSVPLNESRSGEKLRPASAELGLSAPPVIRGYAGETDYWRPISHCRVHVSTVGLQQQRCQVLLVFRTRTRHAEEDQPWPLMDGWLQPAPRSRRRIEASSGLKVVILVSCC